MNDQDKNTTPACCGGTCEVSDTRRKAQPVYHVAETETGITIDAALPGVRKQDISVSTTENILTLSAGRGDGVPEDWKTRQVAGRPDLYELKVRLNRSLDPGRITASLENGVLRLDIAKREEAQPRRISVN